MKTQINTLVSGSSNVVGTKSETRNAIASQVISENKESMTVIIRGYQIHLTAHWSVSGKTVTYIGNCPLELYNSFFGEFGLPKKNPSATLIINMDMTANLQTNSKKGFYNKIAESEITIKSDLNKEYIDLLIMLRYAKNFAPHKVQYYEDRITEIITRQS